MFISRTIPGLKNVNSTARFLIRHTRRLDTRDNAITAITRVIVRVSRQVSLGAITPSILGHNRRVPGVAKVSPAVWLVSHIRGIFRRDSGRRGALVIENFKRIAFWPLCAAEEKLSRGSETNNCRLCAKFRRTKVAVAKNEKKKRKKERGEGEGETERSE